MSSLSSAVLLLTVGLVASIRAEPIINSPTTLVQCQPAALTWSDAVPPVYISAVEGTSTASTPLLSFVPQNEPAGTLTWDHVNVTQGTTITLIINDGKGVNNFSGQVTVKPGSSDCKPTIGSGSSSATTSPSSAGTTSGSGSSSTGSSGTGSSGTGSSGTGSTGTPGTGTPASSSSSTTSSHPASGTTSEGASPVSAHNATSGASNSSTKSTTASTTSGGVALSASANSIIAGIFAAVAGVLLAAGTF